MTPFEYPDNRQRRLLDSLKAGGNTCPVMLASSIQASLTGRFADSEYGRGSFTELVKTMNCGQISVNVAKSGITKGQHWHNFKRQC